MRGDERRVVTVRVPPDVMKWINAQATHYGSSQSAEITRLVRDKMDAERSNVTRSNADQLSVSKAESA